MKSLEILKYVTGKRKHLARHHSRYSAFMMMLLDMGTIRSCRPLHGAGRIELAQVLQDNEADTDSEALTPYDISVIPVVGQEKEQENN